MNKANLLILPFGPNHHIIIHQDDDFTMGLLQTSTVVAPIVNFGPIILSIRISG